MVSYRADKIFNTFKLGAMDVILFAHPNKQFAPTFFHKVFDGIPTECCKNSSGDIFTTERIKRVLGGTL